MAYRQPRVPEYSEKEGEGKTLRALILFLKDFTMAAWTANNQRKREIASLEQNMPEMPEIAYPVTAVNGKTGEVQLDAADVGALGAQEDALNALKLGGKEPSAFAAAQQALTAGGGEGQVLAKKTDADYDAQWVNLPQGMRVDLLWENAAQTSLFGAQTISLDLSAYGAVIVLFAFHVSYASIISRASAVCPVGEYMMTSVFQYNLDGSNHPAFSFRTINVRTSGITFGVGGVHQGTLEYLSDNSRSIPLRIYGIREAGG